MYQTLGSSLCHTTPPPSSRHGWPWIWWYSWQSIGIFMLSSSPVTDIILEGLKCQSPVCQYHLRSVCMHLWGKTFLTTFIWLLVHLPGCLSKSPLYGCSWDTALTPYHYCNASAIISVGKGSLLSRSATLNGIPYPCCQEYNIIGVSFSVYSSVRICVSFYVSYDRYSNHTSHNGSEYVWCIEPDCSEEVSKIVVEYMGKVANIKDACLGHFPCMYYCPVWGTMNAVQINLQIVINYHNIKCIASPSGPWVVPKPTEQLLSTGIIDCRCHAWWGCIY